MKRYQNKIIYALIYIGIILFCALPLPYFIESPGTTEDLRHFVTVDGKKDTSSGSFSLTSVSVSRATGAKLLLAYFNDFDEILSKKDLMGNQSTEQFDNIQRFYMETSQNMAKLNALKQADKPYQFEYLGVYVMDVTTKSTFKDKLSIADTVTKIDNKRFDSTKALIKYLQTKQLGSRVEVGYEHSGKSRQTSGKMIKLANGKYGIGITLIDHTEIKSNPEIKIDAGNIGGPSAGLMFTLETYQLLSGKNLRGNLKIAGTGTMADDGEVGRIGGIDKKIATAVKNKVDVFFAPDDTITSEMKQADPKIVSNYQEALRAKKKLKTKLKIIPVKTLQDAVDYLEQQIK